MEKTISQQITLKMAIFNIVEGVTIPVITGYVMYRACDMAISLPYNPIKYILDVYWFEAIKTFFMAVGVIGGLVIQLRKDQINKTINDSWKKFKTKKKKK